MDKKFCIRCKHYGPGVIWPGTNERTGPMCRHPESAQYHGAYWIMGQAFYSKCENMRKADGACGPEGKLFQLRKQS